MAALIQYHGDGVQTELVQLEYAEICAAIELEKCKYHHSIFLHDFEANPSRSNRSHNLEIDGQYERQSLPSFHRPLHGYLLPMVWQWPSFLL